MHVCTNYNMERFESKSRSICPRCGSSTDDGRNGCAVRAAQPFDKISPGLSSLPSAEQVIQRAQDPTSGSIPQGKATNEVVDLTVEDALDRGLRYNLGLYLSERATEQTRSGGF